MSKPKVMHCPRCRNTDQLEVAETTEMHGTTDPGVVRVTDDGRHIVPPGEFYFEPGCITRLQLHCTICDHWWTPRNRTVASGWAD